MVEKFTHRKAEEESSGLIDNQLEQPETENLTTKQLKSIIEAKIEQLLALERSSTLSIEDEYRLNELKGALRALESKEQISESLITRIRKKLKSKR